MERAGKVMMCWSRMRMLLALMSAFLSSGAWGHFLPLDQCDFYFQGHRDK
jgi:hypothetical protein